MENYKDLSFTNVKARANTTWNATNNVVALATTGSPTADQKQIHIRLSMMAKWIRQSLTKPDQRALDLSKKIFSSNIQMAQLKRTVH